MIHIKFLQNFTGWNAFKRPINNKTNHKFLFRKRRKAMLLHELIYVLTFLQFSIFFKFENDTVFYRVGKINRKKKKYKLIVNWSTLFADSAIEKLNRTCSAVCEAWTTFTPATFHSLLIYAH